MIQSNPSFFIHNYIYISVKCDTECDHWHKTLRMKTLKSVEDPKKNYQCRKKQPQNKAFQKINKQI